MSTFKKGLLIFIIFLCLFIIFILSLPFWGGFNKNFYLKTRINALHKLREIVLKTKANSIQEAFQEYKLNDKITLPYSTYIAGLSIKMLGENKKDFNQLIRYRMIQSQSWWAIVELEYGIKGKFFLMITKDNKVIKFYTPFLPEQYEAIYPPDEAKYSHQIEYFLNKQLLR
jgi:hypothetical protein